MIKSGLSRGAHSWGVMNPLGVVPSPKSSKCILAAAPENVTTSGAEPDVGVTLRRTSVEVAVREP